MATQTEQAASPPRASGWRGLFLRLHFYAGVLVGPFVLIAALTGVLYAATPQMESWIYSDQLQAPVGLKQASLADQVKAAQAANPGGELAAVRPGAEPGDTTRVLFNEEGLGESERRAIFVDLATAQVRGDLVAYGTSGALPFRTVLDQLHRNLLLGEPGRLYSELAASWLWVVALGGLVLWVSRRRARRTEKAEKAAKTESARGKSVRRHGTVGLWVLLGAVFLSATGLTWSAYAGENVSALRESLGWATPALKVTGSGEHAGHTGHAGHGDAPAAPAPARPESVDAVLASARAAGIDAASVEIGLPAKPGAPWQVTEVERSWPTQVDAVAVDGTTGQILGEVRFADYPLMAKLARWGIDAHMGVLFGWPNQLALLLLGAGLVTLVVLGYRMWWRRRPTRATGLTFGRPIPRGQWRKAPPALVAGLVLLAAAIGWFVPLFGISLLVFLVVDLLLGLKSRAKADSADVTV
ncbi:peptidase [Amycolatopsis orientalis]|uniref:Peptidase n=1 Tax=Amycolatopsis orientalis TaxID=31958 RepID=A0A193BYS3_AMYOR|nr:PepSY domain-containing protein [Amycolatopsis orientalis]ANN17372.1 peptidase [Amycolatopsis orientalis]